MLWRLLQENVDGFDAFLVSPKSDEGLSKNELRRASLLLSRLLAFGDCELSLVPSLIVILLQKVCVSQQAVCKPIIGVLDHWLISLPGSPCVPVRFYRARSESGHCEGRVLRPCPGKFLLGCNPSSENTNSQEEVEISTGGRQLVGGVQMFLGCTEITRLE